MRLLALLPLAFLAPLAGAAAPQPGAPEFDAVRFFAGTTRGEGRFKVIVRKAEDITVDGRGRVEADGTLVLDQVVTRAGRPPRSRQWRIRRAPGGRYTGTLSDARGPVTGEAVGNRLHLRFTSGEGYAVEQHLILAPDGRSARNRLTARRFGVTVATLDETIRRLD